MSYVPFSVLGEKKEEKKVLGLKVTRSFTDLMLLLVAWLQRIVQYLPTS